MHVLILGFLRANRGPMAAVAVFAMLLVSFQCIGLASRGYASTQQRITVSSPGEAADALDRAGIHGRILVVLDRHSHVVPSQYAYAFLHHLEDASVESPVTPGNFVSGFVATGIAREVHVVVPEEGWDEIVARMSVRWDAFPVEGGYRARFSGASITFTRANDLPRFGEKVVVYLGADADLDRADDYDPAFISGITGSDVADVVIEEKAR